MPILDNRIDINKKYPLSSTIKFAILIAVIFGFALRSCYIKNQNKKIIFVDIKVTEVTTANIDVEFNVINKTGLSYDKPVLVRVLTKDGKEIASKITKIHLKATSHKKGYRIVLTKLRIPIKSADDIGFVVVKLYNPSIL